VDRVTVRGMERVARLVADRHCAGGGGSASLRYHVESLPITLRQDELGAYRAAVIASASNADREACERLLGQLASLEAAAPAGCCLAFLPQPRSHALAHRALRAMRHDDRRQAAWKSRPALHRLNGDGGAGA
jgi:hypothetical protein